MPFHTFLSLKRKERNKQQLKPFVLLLLLLLLSITFPAQTLFWLDQFPVLDLGFI